VSGGAALEDRAAEQTLASLLDDGVFIDGDWIESKDQDPKGEVRLIQLADVGDGVFRDRSSRFLTMEKAKELRCTFLQPGDVLVARMPDPLGRACIFPGVGQPAVTAVDVCILRPHPDRARPEWLVKAVNSPEFRSSMQEFVRGTTRQRISRKNLGTMTLDVPSVKTQLEVAGLIDRIELKRGSAGIHVASARQSVDRFRQAILAAACSGLLSAGWREAHPESGQGSDELLRELRSPGATGLDHESLGDSFDLPDTWRVATGAEAFIFVTSGSRGWAKYYSDKGPAFLRVGNLDRHRLDLDLTTVQAVTPPSSAESKRTRVQQGDLLISITAEVGMVGVVPSDLGEGYVNQHVAIARPHPQLNSRYLAAFVAAPPYGEAQLDALQRGATKAGLGLDDIRALRIPLPPFGEQFEIARSVDQLMSIADGLEFRIDRANHRIDRSSQAVLARAFRGELDLNVGAV
jgi:type I restriction enzyme S subunit